jgi:hypothetical protein
MKRILRLALVVALMTSTAHAGLFEEGFFQRGFFLERCPCGPSSIKGPIRLLFPQGHKGADFRDACRRHDQGYETFGFPRERADTIFLTDLLAACGDSRRPVKAERKARWMHDLVVRFGDGAYQTAQLKALGAK